jgi:2-polyprenyl-6-methoxyphenol hydroxylase-like FAD-dependent oxidoreductase
LSGVPATELKEPAPAPTLTGRHVLIIGGRISGLATALIRRRRGARITLLEPDAVDNTVGPGEAFATWERAGAPQVRHSHIFHTASV